MAQEEKHLQQRDRRSPRPLVRRQRGVGGEDAQSFAHAADVGPDVERAGRQRAAHALDAIQAVDDHVAPRAERIHHPLQRRRAQRRIERDARGLLRIGRDAREIVDVQVAEELRFFDRRQERPPDAAAGPGVALRDTGDDDGALGHARQRGDRLVCDLEDDVLVDLVGEDARARRKPGAQDFRNLRQIARGRHAAGRIRG